MPGLGLALSLVGLASQAFGLSQSASANNALRAKLLERSNSLNDVFNKNYNMDYMQTPGAKNTLAAYQTGLKQVNKNAEGRAVMAGSTPEAVIADKEKSNENYGDFIRKVAGGADAHRANLQSQYNTRRDNLDNQIYASDQAKASQWDNFIKNAGNLGVAGISAGTIQKPSGNWYDNLTKIKSPTTFR
jgi:hypothetical protein